MASVIAWDTNVVTHLRPGSEAHRAVLSAARAGSPIALPAPVVSEVSYGVAKSGDPALSATLGWIVTLIATHVIAVLPVTGLAAEIAGRLRAEQPLPPPGPRRRRRPKADLRVAWFLDILTAATTWVHGADLVTRDRRHFLTLAAALPGGDRKTALAVLDPPF